MMNIIIVAGVDGSETAWRAAEKAATLALALNAQLRVLFAFNVSLGQTIQSAESTDGFLGRPNAVRDLTVRYASEAERTVSAVAEKLMRRFPELQISHKAVESAPGVALISEAKRLKADMIVVGNKRVQGPARVLGSIARTVASEAPCDLYVVHTHPR